MVGALGYFHGPYKLLTDPTRSEPSITFEKQASNLEALPVLPLQLYNTKLVGSAAFGKR